MSFNCLNWFEPNEHTEDYHMRKPNDEIGFFKNEDKNHIYGEDKLSSFETIDKLLIYSSKLGFNDIKFSFAFGEENMYLMLQ